MNASPEQTREVGSKYGCVVLLDALGTRMLGPEECIQYLDHLKDIKKLLSEFSDAQQDAFSTKLSYLGLPPESDFHVRFFGDTILVTLPCEKKNLNWHLLTRIFWGVANLIAHAMERGILFRGAVAVGEYVETRDAVLGPAVNDAAQWYDLPDLFGAIATPSMMLLLRYVLSDPQIVRSLPEQGIPGLAVQEWVVPLNTGKTLTTVVADWMLAAYQIIPEAETNLERWFLKNIRRCPIPPEVESKY